MPAISIWLEVGKKSLCLRMRTTTTQILHMALPSIQKEQSLWNNLDILLVPR